MRVLFSDGAPVKRATIFIRDRNSEQLDIDTDSNGIAKALLVTDVQYELQAWKRLDSKVSWHSLLSKTGNLLPVHLPRSILYWIMFVDDTGTIRIDNMR